MKHVPPPRNTIAARSLQDEQKWEAGPFQIVTDNRTKPAKRKPIPQLLDKMHEKANTTHNLHSIRPSLELANDSKKSRSSNATPNFDLKLTTLKRSRSPTPGESISTDDCWDEFPLISEVQERGNTISDVGPVEVEGCKIPPPKRSRMDVAAGSLGPLPSHKKVYCTSLVSPYSRMSGHLARRNSTVYQVFDATTVSPWL